ncbi:MAG: tetratricopeptide repeat protein [Coriobacteriia bacterium]
MASDLPKVRSTRRPQSVIVWSLAGVVVLLIVAVAYLALGGSLFSTAPQTDIERDYMLLTEALRSKPNDPAVLMTLAENEYELGKTGDALEHAAKAVEVAPDTSGFAVRYAQLLLLEGEFEKAREQAEREIELDTDTNDAGARFILGQILFEAGETEAAIAAMEEGLAMDYTAADVRIVYGEMLAETGDKDRAISQFKTALLFLPGNERAIAGLAALGVSYEATATTDPHASTETTP